MPAWLIPAIAALGQVVSSAIGNKNIRDMNDRTFNYNERMYNKQRQDSLADFAMQNEYNSPTSQMKRLREAGLNPNLVYGNGSATEQAAPIRAAQVESYRPQPGNYQGYADAVPTFLQGYLDIKMKQQQLDNLKTQNTVMVQDAILKQVTAGMMGASTQSKIWDTERSKSLFAGQLDALKLTNDKLMQDMDINKQQNERAIVAQSSSLQQAAQSILESKARTLATQEQTKSVIAERAKVEKALKSADLDNELKQLDINLKRNGIQPSDNIAFRALAQLLAHYGLTLDNILPKATQGYKKMSDAAGRGMMAPGNDGFMGIP